MKFKLLNIKDSEIRSGYSKKLQDFENQFTYPLGEKRFHIVHGTGDYDYFSFFEQMGDVHYMVVEINNEIIGVGCAILRKLNNTKVWYLCDFKIQKEHRKKYILEKMFLKYLIPFYFKAQRMFFVNMSKKENNGLIKKAGNVFKLFPIDIIDLYFFEWNYEDFSKLNFSNNVIFVTNKNKKDIIIENQVYDIYHAIDKNSYISNQYQIVDKNSIKNTDTIMYCNILNENVSNLLKENVPSTIGSFVSHKFNMKNFYSVEI